jgi:hypothetical protein
VLLGDVRDELEDENGLADAGAAEEARFAALGVRLEQVDDLDAGLEHLDGGGLLVEWRSLAMDGPAFLGLDRSTLVDGLAEDVHDASERLAADGDGDGQAEIDGLHAADHAVGGLHRDAAHLALADVLRHFGHDVDGDVSELALIEDADRIEDRGEVPFLELDVEGGSDDLNDAADFLFLCLLLSLLLNVLLNVLLNHGFDVSVSCRVSRSRRRPKRFR